MPDLFHRHRIPAALVGALAAAHAAAQGTPPSRAAMEPVPGVHVSYERLGPAESASPPGRFDASLATPAGTLRTSVQALPAGERQFERGATTFEMPGILGGQLQLREGERGGTAAAWRGRLDAGLAAETLCEWTPVRSAQELKLQQSLDEQHVARALVSTSRTASAQGQRWDFEIVRDTGFSRWTAGLDAADRTYVSGSGGAEARAGLRVGTQWQLLRYVKMEARYTRQRRDDAEDAVSSVMLGTRFDLPRRVSLVTSVESDANEHHKASLTLTVPVDLR